MLKLQYFPQYFEALTYLTETFNQTDPQGLTIYMYHILQSFQNKNWHASISLNSWHTKYSSQEKSDYL